MATLSFYCQARDLFQYFQYPQFVMSPFHIFQNSSNFIGYWRISSLGAKSPTSSHSYRRNSKYWPSEANWINFTSSVESKYHRPRGILQYYQYPKTLKKNTKNIICFLSHVSFWKYWFAGWQNCQIQGTFESDWILSSCKSNPTWWFIGIFHVLNGTPCIIAWNLIAVLILQINTYCA